MAGNSNLILVWGMETDDPADAPEAAWISDLITRTVSRNDLYPVRLRAGAIEINAAYDCPVSPLEILTPETFLERYPQPGRLPEPGEILTGLVDQDEI